MSGEQVPCGYASEGQGATPLAAAIDGGSMRAHGIEATLTKQGSAHAVVDGLLSRRITFGNLAAPALVDAVGRGAQRARGEQLVFLAGGVNQQFLVARPGATLDDVRGQPLGASSGADLGEFLCAITMDRVLKAESEVRYLGGSRARLDALLAGEIAASPLSPPIAIEAKHAGCAWLFDYAELGLNFAIGGIAARRETVREEPDLVARFLRGYLAGQRHYKQDRDFGVSMHERYGETSRAIAEETYDVTHAGFRDVPDPATEGMQLRIDFWKAKGTLNASFALSDAVDSGPVLAVTGGPQASAY